MQTSAIFYMGSKKKLINKGLIDLFPHNINRFIDLFAGSGIVSMNTEANEYFVNDINDNLFNLYSMFKYVTHSKILSHIQYFIDRFCLETGNCSYDNRSKTYDKHNADIHKISYKNLVDHYNYSDETRSAEELYTILIYCFCHQMRFNSNGDFNMPCGNGRFTDDNKQWIKQTCQFFRQIKVHLCNNDFRTLYKDHLAPQDFIYIDSPYFNTTATYNENGGWTIKDDLDLFELCEYLNSQGVKWGMSNVFNCKGKENTHLIEWCEHNNWNVYTFDKVTYSACGKGNSNAQEVYICNY